MLNKYDTIIVGGGQGGLSTSYYLRQQNRSHVILEQSSKVASAWRDGRWDSFTLVTPNWAFRLPGAEYRGDHPDDFLSRDEVVAAFENYVERYALPIVHNARVTGVEAKPGSDDFLVHTSERSYEARNVVMATGLFQRPRVHPVAHHLAADIAQVHSSTYRNPAALAPGAVLVVGSSQSGCQIAQELHQSGRTVYLCVGRSGRAPRQYRGKDSYEWAKLLGISERTVDQLASPRDKFAPNPHFAGKRDGGSLNLHQFARDGIRLLGRLQAIDQHTILLAPDLKDSLKFADDFEATGLKGIDQFIEKHGLDCPPETIPRLTDGYDVEIVDSLDLRRAGITTVIWATGYSFDFTLVDFPVFDADGYPVQKRGATAKPGLFFVGLPWLHKQKSGLLNGVGEDAAYIAQQCR